MLAYGCKKFRLLDGVNAKVGFHVQIKVQHVFRIACFFGNHCQDLSSDRVLAET